MRFDTYVPRPGFSVRPPDLPPGDRAALRDHEVDTDDLTDALREIRAASPPAPTPSADESAPAAPGTAAPAAPPTPAPAAPDAAAPAPPERSRSRRVLRRAVEIPLLAAGALLLAFLIKTFLFQAFYIPTGSMVPALEVGDRVLVEKVSYRFRDPQRGEIVVFQRPGVQEATGLGPAVRSFLEGLGVARPAEDIDLIKRVIGLPGETVEVHDGTVVVDGRALPEDYIIPDGQSFPPVTVPAGSFYVMGDNRASSDDSRLSLGPVPRGEVVGRAFVILWPPSSASASLRTDYAGGDSPAGAAPTRPPVAPPALPRPDDPPEAPPP